MSIEVLEIEIKNLKELVIAYKKQVEILENMIIRNDKNHEFEKNTLMSKLEFKQEGILGLIEQRKMESARYQEVFDELLKLKQNININISKIK